MNQDPGKYIRQLLEKAVQHHLAGQAAKANSLYDKVLKADAKNPDALNLKGVLVKDAGHFARSLVLFDRAIAASPQFPEAHFNRALALVGLMRHEDALRAYQDAIRFRPQYADARVNIGLLLHTVGRKAEAIAVFRALSREFPGDARGFYNLGVCLEQSLASSAENVRGEIAAESEASLRRALALEPNNPDIHYALANLHTFVGAYRDAIERLEVALKLRPNWPDAWNNLASQWEGLGDRRRALAIFDQALDLAPAHAGAAVNRAMTSLSLGRLDDGWDGFARRFEDPRFPFRKRAWPWPAWSGEDLSGKSILLYGDQGVGDELLYGTMIPDIAARARECVVECDPRLVSLYTRSFPGLEIVSTRPADDVFLQRRFDFQCSVIDAGRYLRRNLAAFPNRRGTLKPDPQKVATLRQKWRAHAGGKMLVGLSWRSINPGMGHQKGVALADFLPLLRDSRITAVNLQYGAVEAEIAALREQHHAEVFTEPTVDTWTDLDGYAALVGAMDLVVTVSNTAAHFAGTLDVPTYVYVPNGRKRIWYWFDEGRFCPWYRSTRIMRQPLAATLHEILQIRS